MTGLMKASKQMMFVSGETGEPSTETTGIIEEIVRQQVVEIVGSLPSLADANSNSSLPSATNMQSDGACAPYRWWICFS